MTSAGIGILVHEADSRFIGKNLDGLTLNDVCKLILHFNPCDEQSVCLRFCRDVGIFGSTKGSERFNA
jgi:hypothetical protein